MVRYASHFDDSWWSWGESKTKSGRWKAVNDKTLPFCIPEGLCLTGFLDLYGIINECLTYRESINISSKRFFSGVKMGGYTNETKTEQFFTRQHLRHY